MQKVMLLLAGLLAVFLVIMAQLVLPFAFDFLSTLAIYGIGVWFGTLAAKTS